MTRHDATAQAERYYVIDGSNVGRWSTGGFSLDALREVVATIRSEFGATPDHVVAIVDSSSKGVVRRRGDAAQVAAFEQAEKTGEIRVAPANRAKSAADEFLLRTAEKLAATVVSNDLFKEFHEAFPWLFDDGRVMSATHMGAAGFVLSPVTVGIKRPPPRPPVVDPDDVVHGERTPERPRTSPPEPERETPPRRDPAADLETVVFRTHEYEVRQSADESLVIIRGSDGVEVTVPAAAWEEDSRPQVWLREAREAHVG